MRCGTECRFHSGNPKLSLDCVGITKLCKILLEEVSVLREKVAWTCLNQIKYTVVEEVVLMHCKTIKSVVDIGISKQPLSMSYTE
jgi:hypothetical protein